MTSLFEMFTVAEAVIPVWQIILLLFLSTCALLYGRAKLALLMNYLFTLNWGYISNQEAIFENIDNPEVFTSVYFGVGAVFAVAAALGFIFQSR